MPGKYKHNEGHRKKEKKKLYRDKEKAHIQNPEHPTKQDINAMYRKMWGGGNDTTR